MVAAPYEESRQIQTVVGVQVGKQYADGAGVGVPLQRAEHAPTEVDGEWRGMRCRHQVTRSRRIWPGDTTGTAQYGDSHAHKLAMPDERVTKTSPHLASSLTISSLRDGEHFPQ